MLRYATLEDLDFVHSLVVEGAVEGHFNEDIIQNPKGIDAIRSELQSIVTSLRRIPAQCIIYEQNSNPVGFLISSAVDGKKGNELWMAAIAPTSRGKGYGADMLDQILSQFLRAGVVLTARCLPASVLMFRMLQTRGFKHVATGEKGVRVLVLL